MKKIKVAISQRIIPHYRVPAFAELASRENIDLTVYYGKGFATGSQVNASLIEGFKAKKLFTIMLNYKGIYKTPQLRVWHPFLFFHLIAGNYDVVIAEPTSNFYNDIFIWFYCKLFRKKFIWHESGMAQKNEFPLYRRLINPIASILIKGADAFITYTSAADKSLLDNYLVNPEKIFRAQNTIDTSKTDDDIIKFQPLVTKTKKELGLNGHKVCLYVGGIELKKEINKLISAASNINDKGIPTKILVIGDGPDKNLLINQLTEQELDQTIFIGKKIEDITLYILLSDVVVLPSLGGLSVVQALACGKPFIGSEKIEHMGIKDYITDGVNGFLVKDNEISSLQNSIEKIFSDESLYKELCKNAYKTSKTFTIARMVDGMENSIKFVINQK
jgi:glycosyltransferase involved in cell wall biosynthesis